MAMRLQQYFTFIMGLYLNVVPKEGILDMRKIQRYLDTLARICTLYINIPKPKVSKYIIHWPFNLVSDKGMDVQLRQCQHSLSRLYFYKH